MGWEGWDWKDGIGGMGREVWDRREGCEGRVGIRGIRREG